MHKVTLIPGDGTGPEIAEATVRCIEATGVKIEWDVQHAGVDIMEKDGTPIPDSVIESIRRTGIALKGPITTPIGSGFQERKRPSAQGPRPLRLPAPLQVVRRRPQQVPGHRPRRRPRKHRGPLRRDRVQAGGQGHGELIEFIKAEGKGVIRPDSAISIKPISITATERIVKFAFDYARANSRRKVTAVHKANIMKMTDGLFLETRAQSGGNVPGNRVRGPDRRQYVHAARAKARTI